MDSIERILNFLGTAGLVAAGYLLSALQSYVTKKGSNLATKEDIREITRKVEEVRSEYRDSQQNRVLIERDRQRHELRLAALDRRLTAHQEAYTLWWNLLGSVHKKDEIGKVVVECQDWFVRNRLYLEPEVARAFSEAYHAAFNHRDYVEARDPNIDIKENWNTIRKVGEIIVEAVRLPILKEYSPVEGEVNEKGERLTSR